MSYCCQGVIFGTLRLVRLWRRRRYFSNYNPPIRRIAFVASVPNFASQTAPGVIGRYAGATYVSWRTRMQPIRTNQYLLPQFYQPRTKEKLSAGASPVPVLPAISQQQNYRGWRRVEDSNLRTPYEVTRFRGARIQPLCQLSVRFPLL